MLKSPIEADRMQELEESVWSVVQQENECGDLGEGVQNSCTIVTDARRRYIDIE